MQTFARGLFVARSRKCFSGFLTVLALFLLSLEMFFPTYVQAASAMAKPHMQKTTFTLDGVPVILQSNALPTNPFVVAKPTDALQLASAKNHNPYFSFDVIAVPYKSSTQANQALEVYTSTINSAWVHQTSLPQTSISLILFGKQVKGTLFHVTAPTYAGTTEPVIIGEWETTIDFRVWIVRITQQVIGQKDAATTAFTAKLQGTNLISTALNQPSSSLKSNISKQNTLTPLNVSGTLGLPSWWNGQMCDTGAYSGSHPQTTNGTPVQYYGVYDCGPRPAAPPLGDGAGDVAYVTFPGGHIELEWECVELSKRWLNLAYNIPDNYGADGDGVVLNYPTSTDPASPNSRLQKIVLPWAQQYIGYGSTPVQGTSFTSSLNNISIGTLSPGDVISFRGPHTSIVTAVNIDSNGNGSFKTMDQNAESTSYTYHVSNWYVTQSYAGDIVGWLHDTQNGTGGGSSISQGGPVVARTSTHLDVFWAGTNGAIDSTYWESGNPWATTFSIAPAGSAPSGAPATAIARTSTHMDVFWVTPNGAIDSTYWDASSGWATAFSISPAGSAQPGALMNVVARTSTHMDLFWAGTNGAIDSTYWDASSGWATAFSIAPAGSAQSGTPVSVVARTSSHMDVFWVTPIGAIYSTYWESGNPWATAFSIAHAGSAQPGALVSVIARTSTHMDLFWVTFNGAIYSTYWDASSGWWGTLAAEAPAGSTQPGAPVSVVARTSTHMDLFWAGTNGAIDSMYWDSSSGWATTFSIVSAGSTQSGTPVSIVARTSSHMDVFWAGTNGAIDSTYWDASSGWATAFSIAPLN